MKNITTPVSENDGTPRMPVPWLPPIRLGALVNDLKSICLRERGSDEPDSTEAFAEACEVAEMFRNRGKQPAVADLVWPEGFVATIKPVGEAESLRQSGIAAIQDYETFARELEAAVQLGQGELKTLSDCTTGDTAARAELREKRNVIARKAIARIEGLANLLASSIAVDERWRELVVKGSGRPSNSRFPTQTSLPVYVIESLVNMIDLVVGDLATQALQEGDWFGFFFKMPSLGNSRLAALLKMKDFLSDSDYWQCVRAVWCDSEVTWPDRAVWRHLFTERSGRNGFMTPDELSLLEGLPDEVVIYRGFAGRFRDGISWTLSREKAEMFAKYSVALPRSFACGKFATGTPKIVTGKCKKSDILALNNDREEQDVIIFPEQVSDKRVEKLHAKTHEAAA